MVMFSQNLQVGHRVQDGPGIKERKENANY